MNRDSSVNDESTRLAEIEAIGKAFERAYLAGDVGGPDDSTYDFDDWLIRVDPELRPRLAHHLTLRHQQLRSANAETSDLSSTNVDWFVRPDVVCESVGVLRAPSPADEPTWEAVFTCGTLGRLGAEAKNALASALRRRTFQRGEHLLRQGQPATGLHLLTCGRVEVIDTAGPQQRRIDFDGPGSILGEMSLLIGQRCTADVIAISPTEALVLPVEAFERLRAEFPELEIALSQLVSDRLGQRSHDALCGKELGGFRLIRCINRGAMGVVYEAESVAEGDRRALKMLRHRFIADSRAQDRFNLEAELLAGLSHPHVMRLHGHFLAYRTRFLILDLCDGGDLKRVIIEKGPLPEPIVRKVLGQIASGLAYAHGHGALHLDLKPANILVDHRGHVSITDFGLGRLIQSDGCDDRVAGTPPYMPPEQFRGTDVAEHCDWYALGCLGIELLTGEMLFNGSDVQELYTLKHRLPEELWPGLDVSEELRRHLQTALEPSIDRRRVDLAAIARWAGLVPEIVS